MYYWLIDTNGDIKALDFKNTEDVFTKGKALLGDADMLLEPVRLGHTTTVWVDEEGAYKWQPNRLASIIFGQMLIGDVIVETAVGGLF